MSNGVPSPTAQPPERQRTPARVWLVRLLRAALIVILWLTVPIAMLLLFLSPMAAEAAGFLGILLLPVIAIAATAFIARARRHDRLTIVFGCVTLVLVAAFAGSAAFSASQINQVGEDYDFETAGKLGESDSDENLQGGYEQYRPFTSEVIARLDEPSELKFGPDDSLPRVDCATALLPLASSLVTATYPEEATTVQWEQPEEGPGAIFQYNNTSWGFQRLVEGRTDVFFGALPGEQEVKNAQDRGVEFECTPVGREGFVFLVNANNPVDSLTVEQVRGIYSGKITNWKQVGGADEPIVAYQRNKNSGSQAMMERFMGGKLVNNPPSTVYSSMGGLVRSVADYDNGQGAIGYSFRYYVTNLVGDYPVKLLAIEGVEPTAENITRGTYPITGDFYAVTRKGDEDPNLARFLEWVCGAQGQELVEKSGYARLQQKEAK